MWIKLTCLEKNISYEYKEHLTLHYPFQGFGLSKYICNLMNKILTIFMLRNKQNNLRFCCYSGCLVRTCVKLWAR
jgi:hypothetical protein